MAYFGEYREWGKYLIWADYFDYDNDGRSYKEFHDWHLGVALGWKSSTPTTRMYIFWTWFLTSALSNNKFKF